jgi:hypothetical protein
VFSALRAFLRPIVRILTTWTLKNSFIVGGFFRLQPNVPQWRSALRAKRTAIRPIQSLCLAYPDRRDDRQAREQKTTYIRQLIWHGPTNVQGCDLVGLAN